MPASSCIFISCIILLYRFHVFAKIFICLLIFLLKNLEHFYNSYFEFFECYFHYFFPLVLIICCFYFLGCGLHFIVSSHVCLRIMFSTNKPPIVSWPLKLYFLNLDTLSLFLSKLLNFI